jgi:hypothetical protein
MAARMATVRERPGFMGREGEKGGSEDGTWQ